MTEETADDDWSEMELRSLRTLAASGAAIEEIAALMKRPQEAVLSKLVALGEEVQARCSSARIINWASAAY